MASVHGTVFLGFDDAALARHASASAPILGQCLNPVCGAWVRPGAGLIWKGPQGRAYACDAACAAMVDRALRPGMPT